MFGRFVYNVTYNNEIPPTYLSAGLTAVAVQSGRASVVYAGAGGCGADASAVSFLVRRLFGLPELLPCVALTAAEALRKASFSGVADSVVLAEAEVFLFHWARLIVEASQWASIPRPATDWLKTSRQETVWR